LAKAIPWLYAMPTGPTIVNVGKKACGQKGGRRAGAELPGVVGVWESGLSILERTRRPRARLARGGPWSEEEMSVSANENGVTRGRPGPSGSSPPAAGGRKTAPRRLVLLAGGEDSDVERVLAEYTGAEGRGK